MKIYYYGLKYHEAFLVARMFFKENNITLIRDFEKALTEKHSILSAVLTDAKSSKDIRLVLVRKGRKYIVLKWSDLLVSLIH